MDRRPDCEPTATFGINHDRRSAIYGLTGRTIAVDIPRGIHGEGGQMPATSTKWQVRDMGPSA